MRDSVEHDVAIQLAKAQAAGTVSPLAEALIAQVAQLRAAADITEDEMARLAGIEAAAEQAWEYHRRGKSGGVHDDDGWDDPWDARHMVKLLDALGNALCS
jgi:DNA-binding XRE family transcriptional regulator